MKITNIEHNIGTFKDMYKHRLLLEGSQHEEVITWSKSPEFHIQPGTEIVCEFEDKIGEVKAKNVRTNEEELLFIRMTALGNASRITSDNDSKMQWADTFRLWILSKEDRQIAQASVKYYATQIECGGIVNAPKLEETLEENYLWLLG